MKLFRNYRDVPIDQKFFSLLIGNFDGLHVGHQSLFHLALQRPPVLVLSFDPHPMRIVNPKQPYSRLRPVNDLVELCETWKIDGLLLQNFDENFRRLTAEEFCKQIIFDHLKPRRLIVGPNFRFGFDRQGDADFLKRFCDQSGMSFATIEPVQMDGEWVSTSRIKQLIKAGSLSAANAMLGRPFYIDGEVAAGNARGRVIGFPTANLSLGATVIPALGVYVCRVTGAGLLRAPAVANIGVRPTLFNDQLPRLEVHILDFSGELLGTRLKVELLQFLRAEKKFNGAAELQAQIQHDVAAAREQFAAGV